MLLHKLSFLNKILWMFSVAIKNSSDYNLLAYLNDIINIIYLHASYIINSNLCKLWYWQDLCENIYFFLNDFICRDVTIFGSRRKMKIMGCDKLCRNGIKASSNSSYDSLFTFFLCLQKKHESISYQPALSTMT